MAVTQSMLGGLRSQLMKKVNLLIISIKFYTTCCAFNDDPELNDVDIVSSQMTVVLLADIFNIRPSEVAMDVINEREG